MKDFEFGYGAGLLAGGVSAAFSMVFHGPTNALPLALVAMGILFIIRGVRKNE